ncbi:hypothetical protein [Vallicoccus soli]|uniref:Uncharacterized protein n=1 Tax=Vallicoccus soli TaxID=2339232 RepID=A0A3A3YYP7_9ACTN|nr:hypothetical protein [Vallicoccus soli]RJK93167.1 hypothetical protein D5H78_17320 [Vallicoccus soli]
MTRDGYCWDCARVRGRAPEANDFAKLCHRDGNIAVPCLGCAEVVWVDHRGRRVEGTGVPVEAARPVPAPRLAERRAG